MDFLLGHLIWVLRIVMIVLGAIHALRDHFMKRVPDSVRDFLVSPLSREWWTNSYAWHHSERSLYLPMKELWYDNYPPWLISFFEQGISLFSDAVHALGTIRGVIIAMTFSYLVVAVAEAVTGSLTVTVPWGAGWKFTFELLALYGAGFFVVWGPCKPLLDLIPKPELTKANRKRNKQK